MVKPDGLQRRLVGEIISRFERKGFTLLKMRRLSSTDITQVIQKHYEKHSQKMFYDKLISFITSGPIVSMIWEGNVDVAKSMVGETNPLHALPGTIRGDYSSSLPENLVHCSDDTESARQEVLLWQDLL